VIEYDAVANLGEVEPLFRELVGADADLAFDIDTEWHWAWRARIRSDSAYDDEVVVRGTLDYFDLRIPRLDVGTPIMVVDWDAVDLRGVIAAIVDVALEYLSGRGEVRSRRVRGDEIYEVYLETSLGEWVLGRDVSVTPHEW